MGKTINKSKRVQISFIVRKNPEEELILNFLDSLSPSKRAELIMALLKKYTGNQLAKKEGMVKIFANIKETESLVKFPEEVSTEEPGPSLVEEELATEVLTKEVGESIEQLKPEETKKDSSQDDEFEENLKIARQNIGLLNKSKR